MGRGEPAKSHLVGRLAVEKELLPLVARVKEIASLTALRCLIEHGAGRGADKEREALIPFSDHLFGELLFYERHLVNATDGRIRTLLPEALF
jgi:hypothetical protein